MNTSFERNGTKSTVEWYTPKYIIDSLGGSFDLDPSSCEIAINLNKSAKTYYTKEQNGLKQEWEGEIFLNPPYSSPEISMFMKKMSEHQNGIALIYNRADSKWFRDYILEKADAIIFLSKRIKFIRQDGTEGKNPSTRSVLVAYGDQAIKRLEQCTLDGKLIYLQNKQVEMDMQDWTTTNKRDKDGNVSVLEHQFRNGVRLETDLQGKLVRKYHGDVMVDEFGLNPNIDSYVKLLENTADSIENNKI